MTDAEAFEKTKSILLEWGVAPEKLTLETLLSDLHWDSLDIVELVVFLETEYGVDITDEEAEKFKTVGDLVKKIDYLENRDENG